MTIEDAKNLRVGDVVHADRDAFGNNMFTEFYFRPGSDWKVTAVHGDRIIMGRVEWKLDESALAEAPRFTLTSTRGTERRGPTSCFARSCRRSRTP